MAFSLNVLRTHYTAGQRAMWADRMANYPSGAPQSQVSKFRDLKSIETAAKEVGVSPSQVGKARYLRREGAPEVADAVSAGRLTLHAAALLTFSFGAVLWFVVCVG